MCFGIVGVWRIQTLSALSNCIASENPPDYGSMKGLPCLFRVGPRAHWDRNSPKVEMPNSIPVLPTHSLLKPVLKGSNVPLPEVPPKYWVILGSPQSRSEQLTPVHTAVGQTGPQP